MSDDSDVEEKANKTTTTTDKTTTNKGEAVATEATIRSLFVLFNSALATGVPKIVARRYAPDAVLLPSTSEAPCMTPQAIEDFYGLYLLQKPQKRILHGRIRMAEDQSWAEDAGICEITLQDPARSDVIRRVKARYSFLYMWESTTQQWKILHHHISLLGGGGDVAAAVVSNSWSGPMTTERVRNLFQILVQDAWETGNADAVAKRFHARDGVVMPLNPYERPRQGFHEIFGYFEEFLVYNRPVITEVERAYITLDDAALNGRQQQRWAKDVGTMQINFRNDQSNLHARYSLDYVLDETDGIWKILQFQMTPLPQDWHQLRGPQSSDSTRDPLMDYEDTISPLPSAVSRPKELSSHSKSYQSGPSIEKTAPPSFIPPVVTEDDVRGWFREWNAALATGEAEVVANRYASQAVLIPAVSFDNPRTTPRAIKNFYQLFLWSRPQAKVLQSHITIATHYAKDAGVLEYTFRDNGGKGRDGASTRVKERYSFLYVFDEASGWKIAHHHSSAITERMQEDGPRKDAMKTPDNDDGNDLGYFQ